MGLMGHIRPIGPTRPMDDDMTMPEHEPLLSVQDLRVSYHDGTEALRGVSLAVARGQRVGVIGANGAGKTSLLLAIMGGVYFTGRIAVGGVQLGPKTLADVRGQAGLTFQDADDQLFMPTLLEDVAFGPLNQGAAPADAQAAARQAIAAVGLEGMEGRSAHHMSGGQKRCASLATVLSMRVGLLLLDEPAANLDFGSRKRLIQLLGERAEAQLLATHDMDMVRRLCSHVMVLDAGEVRAQGPTQAILDDRRMLESCGLA